MHRRRAKLTNLFFQEDPSVDSHKALKEAHPSEPLGPRVLSNSSGTPPGPKFDLSKVPLDMQSQIVNGARTLNASTPIPKFEPSCFFWKPISDSGLAKFMAAEELTSPSFVSKK